MTVQDRIRLSSVLEEMKRYKGSADKCGLKDISLLKPLSHTQHKNNTEEYHKK